MKFRRRWALILALSSAQLICLLAAVAWYGNWLHGGLTQLMLGQMLAVDSQATAQMTEVIDQLGIGYPKPHSEDWKKLQSMVERIHLPNSGYLSVIDRDSGDLLCHPSLRQGKEVRKVKLDTKLLRHDEAGKHDGNATRSGWAAMPDGMHYITIHDMPERGIMLVADQRDDGIRAAIAHISRPLWMFGCLAAVVLAVLSTLSSVAIMRRYDCKLEAINTNLETLVDRRSRALLNTRDAVIFGLAKLADSRDNETGEHLERIREYASILARRLSRRYPEIDQQYVHMLELASSLHDIGKVGVPDSILRKPGRLTPDERKIMQMHAVVGADCLAAIRERLGDDDFLGMACEIAVAHHERWDGHGYPHGLRGNEIPLSARIVAVADVYDALTTNRVYKDAIPHFEACRMIVEGTGTQFDPDLIEAFVACEDQIRIVADQLSADAVAEAEAELDAEALAAV